MDPKGLLTSGADLAQVRKVSTAAKCGLEIVCSVAVARMREHCQKKNCICRKGHVGRDKCPNLVSMVEARKDLRPTAEKIKTDLEKLVSQTQTLHHSSLQGEVNTSKCASRFQDKIISQELYRETLCSQIKMTEIVPQYSHPWFLFSLDLFEETWSAFSFRTQDKQVVVFEGWGGVLRVVVVLREGVSIWEQGWGLRVGW